MVRKIGPNWRDCKSPIISPPLLVETCIIYMGNPNWLEQKETRYGGFAVFSLNQLKLIIIINNSIFFSVKWRICHISWPSPKVCQIGENGLTPSKKWIPHTLWMFLTSSLQTSSQFLRKWAMSTDIPILVVCKMCWIFTKVFPYQMCSENAGVQSICTEQLYSD